MGLALWICEDGYLVRVALGSVEATVVAGVLDQFDADLLVIPEHRAAPFRATARALEYVHPEWRDVPLTAPLGRLGPLAQNAWRVGFHHLVRRGTRRFRHRLAPERLTRDWLDDYAPPGRTREA